ncbi:MAG: segregation/condensation protein A [Candidatus Margulisiibacteriota bacterium]
MTVFTVALPKFEGPFDLLMAAIHDEKIDIFEISLSQITATYFEYLKRLDRINLNPASEFLLMAAQLLELKSKKVLPAPPDVVLERSEEEIESELAAHLLEYERFKHLAGELKARKANFNLVYSRYHREAPSPKASEIELKNVSLTDLVKAFQQVWKRLPPEEEVRVIKEDELNLDKRIGEVVEILKQGGGEADFEKLFLRHTRLELVLTFLSILELAKRRFILILQKEKFGGICLRLRES